jgi:hypothetical protein
MIGATLALTLGATLLGAYRLSGSPAGAGIVVFLGAWFVAFGCALQLGAILDRVTLASAWRFLLKVTAWAVVLAATGWAILRAPGPELLTGLLTAPVLVGLGGIVVAREDRWAAVGFLVVALALSGVLIPAALERLPTG